MRYSYKKKIYKLIFPIVDAIGNVLFFPFTFFRRDIPQNVQRILLIRCDHIGDILAATVVLEPLRRKFPSARIDFLAPSWASDILRADPSIDGLIEFDAPWFDRKSSGFSKRLKGLADMIRIIKSGRYDVAIDLRGDVRHITAMFLAGVKYRLGYGITGGSFMLTHQAPYMDTMHETSRNMALLKPLGVKSQTPEIKLYLSGEDAREADLLLKETDVEGEYAVLHAVPGHFTKNWEAGSFAQVARYLQDKKKLKPVMVGGADDRGRIPGIIDLSGKTSLTVLGQVLSRASIFIGVDSAPAHIAAAANIPTVVLFSGVNDPEQWAPKGGNVRIIYPGKGKDLSGVDAEEACRVIDEVIGSR